MAKKKNNTKPPLTEKLAETDPKVKTFKVKSEKELGFKKRNYYIGNKNCMIVADAEVDEEIYNAFSDYAKKIFFVQ